MKIILSFDDGRSDSIDASTILVNYGLVGSFHITTGFIDGSFGTDAFGANRKPLSMEDLKFMREKGMEISSHGDKHIMDTEDFLTSLRKLFDWGVCKGKVGFSIPNSKYTIDVLSTFYNENKSSLLYVRAGRSPKCYTFRNKINYLLYKLFKWQFAYNNFNKFNLNNSVNDFPLYSVVITKSIRSKNIIKFIEKHKFENKVLVLMFHSIVEKPTNKWEYSSKDFIRLCDYLRRITNSNEVLVGSLSEFITNNK